MSITFTLPQGFPYVGAGLMSTAFLLVYQNITVSKWRKRAGIKYPQLYAEKAEVAVSKDANIFNCAQRAHQNTLENIPLIYLTTVLSGLKYPIFAAAACSIWTLSRVSYTRGYLTGEPSKRVGSIYKIGAMGMIGLLLSSVYVVGEAIISSL